MEAPVQQLQPEECLEAPPAECLGARPGEECLAPRPLLQPRQEVCLEQQQSLLSRLGDSLGHRLQPLHRPVEACLGPPLLPPAPGASSPPHSSPRHLGASLGGPYRGTRSRGAFLVPPPPLAPRGACSPPPPLRPREDYSAPQLHLLQGDCLGLLARGEGGSLARQLRQLRRWIPPACGPPWTSSPWRRGRPSRERHSPWARCQ